MDNQETSHEVDKDQLETQPDNGLAPEQTAGKVDSAGADAAPSMEPGPESTPEISPGETPVSIAAAETGSAASAEASAPESSRWYILHTYSGFEQRVEQTIRELMRTRQDHGLIHEVVVPTEKVIELGKGGQKRTTTRKFYPGYVMVRMTMTDLSWHLVQSIPKVTGFVGGKNRPAPMGPGEAERILSLMETRQEQPRPKFNFDRGDEVRVVDGPFGGFNGVVEDVNYDKGKLRVSVSIFGRQTPVELDFIQVSKG